MDPSVLEKRKFPIFGCVKVNVCENGRIASVFELVYVMSWFLIGSNEINVSSLLLQHLFAHSKWWLLFLLVVVSP